MSSAPATGFVRCCYKVVEALEKLDDGRRWGHVDLERADLRFVDVQHHRNRFAGAPFDLIQSFGLGETPVSIIGRSSSGGGPR